MTDEGPTRILHLVAGRGMVRGGIETWLMHVLRNSDRERFRMDFVVETTEPRAYDDEIRDLGSQLISCSRHRRPLVYARSFRQILHEHGPYDVVHSHFHHYSGYTLRLAHREGVPIRVAHSHTDYRQDDKNRGTLWRMYVGLMRRWLSRHASIGLAASREAATALYGAAWEADPRWRLLYYGIDLKPFQALVDPGALRAELGIPADALVVGHVGRFDEQKNHAFVVDIAAELIRREPKAYFLLIGGDGPLRPTIEQHVARSGLAGKVIFAGVRPDVPHLMLGVMDAFVFPSLYEGLPLVGIEAQAAGLPLVLSDTVSNEVSVVDPLIRWLSLSQPASVWAEAVLLALRNTTSVTRQEALGLVERSNLNISYSVKEVESVYAG